MMYYILLILLTVPFLAFSQNVEKTSERLHHAGWAFSYAAGTATTGREAMMISTMYSYTLEDWCDIEASIHYTGRSWRGDFMGTSRIHATSWAFEATPMIRLSNSGFLQPFRIGLGVSIHSMKYLSTARDLFNQSLEFAIYSDATYVGGTFKVEYVIPLSSRVDIGVRGQLSLYPLEFQGLHQTIPGNIFLISLGSLGAFARFNW